MSSPMLPSMKIALYGPSNSGKTLFKTVFLEKKPKKTKPTTKVEETEVRRTTYKVTERGRIPHETYRLRLADLPGKDDLSGERISGLQKAIGAILFYDSTDPASAESLSRMFENEILNMGLVFNIIGFVVVGTKKDLGPNKEAVQKAEELKKKITEQVKGLWGYEVPHVLIDARNYEEVEAVLVITENILMAFSPPASLIEKLSALKTVGIVPAPSTPPAPAKPAPPAQPPPAKLALPEVPAVEKKPAPSPAKPSLPSLPEVPSPKEIPTPSPPKAEKKEGPPLPPLPEVPKVEKKAPTPEIPSPDEILKQMGIPPAPPPTPAKEPALPKVPSKPLVLSPPVAPTPPKPAPTKLAPESLEVKPLPEAVWSKLEAIVKNLTAKGIVQIKRIMIIKRAKPNQAMVAVYPKVSLNQIGNELISQIIKLEELAGGLSISADLGNISYVLLQGSKDSAIIVKKQRSLIYIETVGKPSPALIGVLTGG